MPMSQRNLNLAEARTEQRDRLASLIAQLTPVPGVNRTAWPGLVCYRSDRPTVLDKILYSPALCIVAQGAKQARLGDRILRYDPMRYLAIGAPLPAQSQIVEATKARPFLSLTMEVSSAALSELLVELGEAPPDSVWNGSPPLGASRLDGRLLDALIRLVEATTDPTEIRILGPALQREVLYYALCGEQGHILRLASLREGFSPGVSRTLHHIHMHLDERMTVAELAKIAGMSSSSLHEAFKAMTTLTPIQYIKQLRLNQARQVMLEEGASAAEAAFKVGYESPSQFSRDFRRHFGLPPRQYLESRS
ncbi:MAG: AraC family transcriptional regulator [Candidatus Eisenbacteria bacterium]|uniref:AraC family transcriptional regulator n=1 Tax=Eiseniibacteriota bacterium TaxID=2212470 RepID=A0A956RNW7_UNCEI|nr:AraC family transcriptional regulator [Candidatus Eisenbacteria bacterium]